MHSYIADVIDELERKYGVGQIDNETCPLCGYEAELLSAGLHVSSSGCFRLYSEDDEFQCHKCGFPNFNQQTGII